MSSRTRWMLSLAIAGVGGIVYVAIEDAFGLTGLAAAAVFVGCVAVFIAPGFFLTLPLEGESVLRGLWRRLRREAGPTG